MQGRKKMKSKLLVYVNSMNAFGGIERVIANLSSRLADYYDITILVKDAPVSAYALDDRVHMDSIDAELKMNMGNRLQRIASAPINIFKSIPKLRRYLRQHHFDVIYTAFPTTGVEVYFADKTYRNKIVASEHASYYAYNSVYRKMKKWLYPRLSAISVPTTMDTEIYQKLGYKAVYIPHLTTYTEVFDNPLNSKTVINVGRLTGDKQQMLLLEMWKQIEEVVRETSWKLQIIGSGEEKERLEQYVQDNSVIQVEFVPHTTQIKDYYKKAALFAFTSKMEGFGMVLLEAMSFGVPCISFDCPSGPRDIIKDGKNGFLIPCYDVEQFKKMIVKYIRLSDLDRQRFGQGATDTIQQWSNKHIIEQWTNLFDMVMGEN